MMGAISQMPQWAGRIAICATIILLLAGKVSAATLKSSELIRNAKEYNGTKVTYKGEAVTAIMHRGDFSWVTVHDGENAISVWCAGDLAKRISTAGDYDHVGDAVEVEGIFFRACDQHGGELDLHADTLAIVTRGKTMVELPDRGRAHAAALLFILMIIIVIIFRKKI